MRKILVDSEGLDSKGYMAIILGLANIIRANIPDSKIVILSHNVSRDEVLCKFGFEVRQSPYKWSGPVNSSSELVSYGISAVGSLLSSLSVRIVRGLGIKMKTPNDDCDVVIHYNPDWYSEEERGTLRTIYPLVRLYILRSIFYDKPYATLPSSMGPFKSPLAKTVGRAVLNRLNLVVLREEASYNAIRSLGLNKAQVKMICDLAFFCDPAPKERVEEIFQAEGIKRYGKPFVGLCPSKGPINHAFEKSLDPETRRYSYIKSMAEVADITVDKLGANVCLISHHEGDVKLCKQIYDLAKNKQGITFLRHEYSADELKGIIGSFDMFIGGLMHSTIAATSMGVPTVSIAYANKFYGVTGKVMGQEKYIVDIRDKKYEDFLDETEKKIDTVWANREAIKAELAEKVKAAREQAWQYGQSIKGLIR